MYGSSRADSVRHSRRVQWPQCTASAPLCAPPGRRSLSSTTRDVPRKLSSAAARVFEEPEADWATAPAPRSITVTKVTKAPPAAPAGPATYASPADDAAVKDLVARRSAPRTNWTREEIAAVYDAPLLELLRDAAAVHRAHWDSRDVQQCTLLSIKTGGCTEDCGYCSQSVRHKTHVKPTRQLPVDDVLAAAKRAKAAGSSRFCMGAAWRELGNKKKAFREILEMVEKVNAEGLEVCATLGMLNEEQARQLKDAGLTAYNHNLDTSREFYPRRASPSARGGILGLGEQEKDRVGLLHELANLPGGHPESVPINALVAVPGTPIGDGGKAEPVDVFGMCRMIAAARIVLPKTMVRLSAGRLEFSKGEQALMFMAGANSIFNGDVLLLTTPNPKFSEDAQLFDTLGLRGLKPKPTTTHLKREVDAPMAA
ncbi:biotin synthase [Aureococcus anophagefferens]|nr:biotin synthase [Aureococcus anophagefferens]